MRYKHFTQTLTLVLAVAALAAGAEAQSQSDTKAAKVGFTSDGRLLINGEPTFFIGFAAGPPIDLKTPEGGDGWAEMAAGGMRVVRGDTGVKPGTPGYADSLGKYLDVAHAHGVYVWPFLQKMAQVRTPADRDRLEKLVMRFRNHPGIMFWKSEDEPEWGKIPVGPLHEAYELIHRLDPNHPVWFCHAPRGTLETLRPYNAACDVLSTDIYPVSEPPGKHSLEANKGLSMVGDYTKRMVTLADGKKMVFMVLQVSWSGVSPKHNPKNRIMFPTARQERYMLYEAIICGANSVSFFGMPGCLSGRDAELGWNWTYWRTVLKPLLADIKPGGDLYPVLTSPDSKYPLQFTGAPRIEVRTKQVGDRLYIFAAAREGETQSVRFSGLPDGEVTVLQENRSITVKAGAFSDSFAEHDVHIYRVKVEGSK